MERVDSRKTWVDDPIWRSEEFIRERLEFLDQNFPVLFQPYWGQPVDLEYRRRLEIAADCILELKYSDGRAVIPLIGILRAASKEQLIVLDEDRDTSDLGPSPVSGESQLGALQANCRYPRCDWGRGRSRTHHRVDSDHELRPPLTREAFLALAARHREGDRSH